MIMDRVAQPMRILVAMSGGVDSAVAAYLLQRSGHEVAGATMRLFCSSRQEGPARPCCDMEAVHEARRSADRLGIEHVVVDMEETFQREVVGDFIDEYARARTPNPCVRCNTLVKFGPLLAKARRMGFDGVATGHYVIRASTEDGWALFRARDPDKDQSYVLWGLDRSALDRCHFPLGRARKGAVRRLARRIGLTAWNRADSQDICFVPTGEHARFLADRLPQEHPMRTPGPVRSVNGELLGEHEGLLGYTQGQRRGIGVGSGERLYVIRMEPATSTLWVGAKEQTLAAGLTATGGNLLAPRELLEGEGVVARIRYRHSGAPCRVDAKTDRWLVRFEQPQSAVAPGQSVVFYRNGRMLAGATIDEALPVDRVEGRA
jgi:tRNA-uridine 2-sulfurtransferase